MLVELIGFIIIMCAFVESIYDSIIWFTDINKSAGKVWVAHSIFIALLGSILMIGV